MVSTDWFSVRWGKIPEEYVNGILRGYRLTYYLSYRASLPIGGELEKMQQDFNIYTFYYKVAGLVNYAVYNVSIAGFTNAGNGVSEEFFASTYWSTPCCEVSLMNIMFGLFWFDFYLVIQFFRFFCNIIFKQKDWVFFMNI